MFDVERSRTFLRAVGPREMLFLAQQEVVLLEIGHDARFPHSVNLYAFAMSNSSSGSSSQGCI